LFYSNEVHQSNVYVIKSGANVTEYLL